MYTHCHLGILDRADRISVCKSSIFAENEKIVDLQVNVIRQRLDDRHIEPWSTDAAKEHVAVRGTTRFVVRFHARFRSITSPATTALP